MTVEEDEKELLQEEELVEEDEKELLQEEELVEETKAVDEEEKDEKR
jgi:hypothetical protein